MIEMTLEEIKEIVGYEIKVVDKKIVHEKYSKIKVGDYIDVGRVGFVVLDKTKDGILCTTKYTYKNDYIVKFDDYRNDYRSSNIRTILKELQKKLENSVGKDGLLDIEIDLTSLDGLDDYCQVFDKVGLMTLDMYRKYARIIEKNILNGHMDFGWLATPWSTVHKGKFHKEDVVFVHSDGTVSSDGCWNKRHIHPICYFSSSIFEP